MSILTPSFEELAQRYERELYLTCYGILGHREDAADALQETMLRAWRGFRGFRGEAQWRTWFHRIAVNTCIDILRKRKPDSSLDTMAEDGFDPPDSRVSVSGELEAKERKRRLREAIGELNEKDRMLIVLRDVRGMSYEEIASTLRLPLGTVKSRLKRAREHLVKILSADAELFGRENVSNTERRSKR